MPVIDVFSRELKIDFTIDGQVTQYSYRTALVRDVFMELRKDEEPARSLASKLENLLADAAGTSLDNHVVYGVTTSAGNQLYIMYSDFTVYFGLSVEEGRW